MHVFPYFLTLLHVFVMHSSEHFQYSPFCVVFLCSCDKVYYRPLGIFLLGQIVTSQYNPSPFGFTMYSINNHLSSSIRL